jgi:periplasmic divalent cation tolerance protein
VNPASRFHLVLVTAPLLPVARKLAGQILTAKLAACVNILPGVQSHYWWKGRIEKSGEVLMLIKTTAARLRPLRRLVKRHHPYEVPEFIAVPIEKGGKKYLQWIEESTT